MRKKNTTEENTIDAVLDDAPETTEEKVEAAETEAKPDDQKLAVVPSVANVQEKPVLIYSRKPNPWFEVRSPLTGNRYMFQPEHPFQIVKDPQDADYLAKIEGLEIASADRAEEFYS